MLGMGGEREVGLVGEGGVEENKEGERRGSHPFSMKRITRELTYGRIYE